MLKLDSVGNLRYFRKSKKLISLQSLIDCPRSYGNQGCQGGVMERAYNYFNDFGVVTDASYLYKGVDRKCRSERSLFIIRSRTTPVNLFGLGFV